MSAEENIATAKRVLEEAFNQGEVEVFDEVCAADCVSHDPAEDGDVRGIEAHKERVIGYRTAMPDLHVTCEDAFASDDRVCMRWSVRGTNTGELGEMPATGKSVEFTGMSVDRFNQDGQIVETWDQWDNAGFMAQLGIGAEAMAEAS